MKFRFWPKFLTYGNWGGPGYSGGEFQNDSTKVRWHIKGKTRLDRWFRVHDRWYQRFKNRRQADWGLFKATIDCMILNIYELIYSLGVLIIFFPLGLIYVVPKIINSILKFIIRNIKTDSK